MPDRPDINTVLGLPLEKSKLRYGDNKVINPYSLVVWKSRYDFRRHPVRSSNQRLSLGQIGRHLCAETKVGQFDLKPMQNLTKFIPRFITKQEKAINKTNKFMTALRNRYIAQLKSSTSARKKHI